VAAYGYTTLRWGCTSYAEANRPFTLDEVTRAFREGTIPLVALPARDVPGARVFRHATGRATAWIVVCATNSCRHKPDPVVDSERFRRGIGFHNVSIWLTASNVRASKALLAKIHPVVSDLTPESHEGRCFPG
jgi:hypothetical protein